jgi:hypothetical protein
MNEFRAGVDKPGRSTPHEPELLGQTVVVIGGSGIGLDEDVDASEYTFRTSTQIETAAPDLDWLNQGVFISVAGRQHGGVIYETYLVG